MSVIDKIHMFQYYNLITMKGEIVIYGSTFMANFPFYELIQNQLFSNAIYNRSIEGLTLADAELGLQSCHDDTAARINRGHTWEQFLEGYHRLREDGAPILRCVHLIFGLPGEDDDAMLETVRRVAALRPDQVKIHLLHVLRGTVLGNMYERGEYEPLSRERYISLVARALTLLPPMDSR